MLTAVLVKIKVFRDDSVRHLAWFGGMYYPHPQGFVVYTAYERGYILKFQYSKLEEMTRRNQASLDAYLLLQLVLVMGMSDFVHG